MKPNHEMNLAEVTLAILKAAVNIPDGLYARAQYLAKKELVESVPPAAQLIGRGIGARLQALSVTNIMLDVVPGEDGMGNEVYAKSVADVVAKLSQMGYRIEDLETERDALKAENVVLRDRISKRLIDLTNMRSERDALKAEVDQWKSVANDFAKRRDELKGELDMRDGQRDALQSELTKARELLCLTSVRLKTAHHNIVKLMELDPAHKVKPLTDALHTVVYAYKCIDNPPHQSAPAMKRSDSWSKEWKESGFNYSVDTAIKALRYLANNERPIGGEERYNTEHLYQIADDLMLTKNELLVKK